MWKPFYLHQVASAISDPGLKQMIVELKDLRPDRVHDEVLNVPTIHLLDAFYRQGPAYKVLRIEAGHLWDHEYLKTSVQALCDTETYKFLRDLCEIAGDHPERHHRKKLYQALNHLVPKCLPPMGRARRRP